MHNYEEIALTQRNYCKDKFSEKLHCYSGGAGGSDSSSHPQATPAEMIALYEQHLPTILGITSGQLPDTTRAIANAAIATNPLYSQAGLDQLRQFAPGYQRAGAQLSAAQAASTNDLLNGAGGDAARSAVALNNELNPVQAAANRASTDLLGSININGLSGAERSEVERSLGQSNYATGNLGLDNATNIVNNAMSFGNALSRKRTELANAIGTANATAAGQNAQVNPLSVALGAGNLSGNFGTNMFNPTQAQNSTNTPYSFASSFGNQLAGVASAPISQSSSSNASGGCFLTTVCCEWKGLPDDCAELTILRKFRDEVVPESIVKKYYEIAPAIAEKIKNDEKKLQYAWEQINKCITLIKQAKAQEAITTYIHMVNFLGE